MANWPTNESEEAVGESEEVVQVEESKKAVEESEEAIEESEESASEGGRRQSGRSITMSDPFSDACPRDDDNGLGWTCYSFALLRARCRCYRR